jgi:hypothetical protein
MFKDESPESVSTQDVKVLRQSARLIIRTLKGLPLDQRIAKLEELLANKSEVAPGITGLRSLQRRTAEGT